MGLYLVGTTGKIYNYQPQTQRYSRQYVRWSNETKEVIAYKGQNLVLYITDCFEVKKNEKRMRNGHYVFIGLLIAAVFFVRYDLSRRADLVKTNAKNNFNNSSTNTLTVINKTSEAASKPIPAPVFSPPDPQIFKKQFQAESAQIAKIQNDPAMVQNRMKKLAEVMTSHDVQALYDIISDDKINGDQRTLAVELLSIKNNTASLMALQNFVANNKNVNGTMWDRKKELETVLRAQAIESIAAYPHKDIAISTLSYLQNKVDESFLLDRLSRATANLNNEVPTLQQQDEAALKKLVE